jgi:hypothetical protein
MIKNILTNYVLGFSVSVFDGESGQYLKIYLKAVKKHSFDFLRS